MAEKLRKSQIETLRQVSLAHRGQLGRMNLAALQDISSDTAERKLKELVRSGHLTRGVEWPHGPIYSLTDQGRAALQPERADN